MYPTISDLLNDLFGIYLPLPIQSFGFFIAISFIVAAWIVMKELKRKEKLGIISAQKKRVLVGKPASVQELVIMGIVGFILGFKLVDIILNYTAFAENPQAFIFSSQGSIIGGIAGAAILVFLRYREKQKTKLERPKWEEIEVHPYELTGNIIMYGALCSIIGAKIFHNLENLDDFAKDPVDALLSFSGLTFYGGFILTTICLLWYANRNKIPPLVMADSAVTAIMIGYAIGRIGCQVAGDGDWGILNSAYITTADSKVELAEGTQFQDTLKKYKTYYMYEFNTQDLGDVPHKSVKAPQWLPAWMFAYSYPHNVISSGVEIPGTNKVKHNCHLPIPVFPTPFYETIICMLFFVVLWILKNRIKITGVLFSIFLIMNGVERFFIEKIRVNTKYHIFGNAITQAEIISTALFFAGVILLVFILKNSKKNDKRVSL